MAVIFLLALIAIAGEIYSDAILKRSEVSARSPDPAALAIAHGAKSDTESLRSD